MSAIDTTPSAQEAAARDDRLAAELSQANEMLQSLMRVHGPVHPELAALEPAIARLRAAVAGSHEERSAHEAVTELRELTGGYDINRAVCRTHRRLLETLAMLEDDLHLRACGAEPRP